MRIFGIAKTRNFAFVLLAVFLCPCATLHAHPFLWQVTGEHNFYLFGTIHLPDPRVTNLSPEVEVALKSSTSFYAELDLSESNTMQITQSMWLPKHEMLHDLLPTPLKARVSDYLKNINPELNLEFFAKQKIWVLAVTLTILEQQLKYPGLPPLDRALYEQAQNLGLKTGGLESVNDQLSIFESLTREQQIIFLKDTLEFLEEENVKGNGFVEQSLQAYLQGDLDILMTHLMSYMKHEGFYETLLDELIDKRNHKMTETILSLVDEHPEEKFFFAVGAGHFWGETGINALLKERGYSIEVID